MKRHTLEERKPALFWVIFWASKAADLMIAVIMMILLSVWGLIIALIFIVLFEIALNEYVYDNHFQGGLDRDRPDKTFPASKAGSE